MSVIDRERTIILRPGEDSLIAGTLAIGYGLFIMAFGIKENYLIQILRIICSTEYINIAAISLGALYVVLGLGIAVESAKFARFALWFHTVILILAVGYPTTLLFINRLSANEYWVYYGAGHATVLFVGLMALGVVIFWFGLYAATNIDYAPAPEIPPVTKTQPEPDESSRNQYVPINNILPAVSTTNLPEGVRALEFGDEQRPDFNSPYTAKLQNDVDFYSGQIREEEPPPYYESDEEKVAKTITKLLPQFVDGLAGKLSSLDRYDTHSDYDYYRDPMETETKYYSVLKPNDLEIVYGFNFIVRSRDNGVPSVIRFFRRVNEVYFNGKRATRLDYDGNLKTGYEYQLPCGKLLIIYEYFLLIPYITLVVNDQIIIDSPSNPFNRAQHSAVILLFFSITLLVTAIVEIAASYENGDWLVEPAYSFSIAGVLLAYALSALGIKYMSKLAAMFGCILHLGVSTAALVVNFGFISDTFYDSVTYGDWLFALMTMLLMLPVLAISGYVGLYVFNAFIAVNEYHNS